LNKATRRSAMMIQIAKLRKFEFMDTKVSSNAAPEAREGVARDRL
jgi:hypothetical protein